MPPIDTTLTPVAEDAYWQSRGNKRWLDGLDDQMNEKSKSPETNPIYEGEDYENVGRNFDKSRGIGQFISAAPTETKTEPTINHGVWGPTELPAWAGAPGWDTGKIQRQAQFLLDKGNQLAGVFTGFVDHAMTGPKATTEDDPSGQEGEIKSAFDVAKTLMGVGTSTAFMRGPSVGILGGVNSKTFPHDKALYAQNLEQQLLDSPSMFRLAQQSPDRAERSIQGLMNERYGITRGADGLLRHEIDDSMAHFKSNPKYGQPELPSTVPAKGLSVEGPVSNYLDHPELFAAYPELKDVKLDMTISSKYRDREGVYNPKTNTIEIQAKDYDEAMSVLLHELQHKVQHVEGFNWGSNPVFEKQLLQKEQNWLSRAFKQPDPEVVFQNYRKAAGEVEARNVQTRMDMSAADRRKQNPLYTEDVPRSEQNVFGVTRDRDYE